MTIYCNIGATFVEEYEQADELVANLECDPLSVTRGNPITATLDAGGETITNQQWTFNGGGGSASKSGGNSWGGDMATSGTIMVTFDVGQFEGEERSCNIAVNDRTGLVTQAMNVASAQFSTGLSGGKDVPPNDETDLGVFAHDHLAGVGLQTIETIPSGPNEGYQYFVDPPRADPYYWINPDLTETGSDFYAAQCGMNDYIEGSDLLTQTRRHEYNHTVKSHLGYTNSRLALEDAAHNYGVHLENRVFAPNNPMEDIQEFAGDVVAEMGAIEQTLKSENDGAHGSSSIPHVNYDENNNPLGNVNWGPLIQCVAG